MKTSKLAIKGIGLAAVLLLALTPLGAMAAATAAGTSVTDSATLDYDVNSIAQSQITPATPAVFKVDRKLALSITSDDGANIDATPSATKVALKFTVTNATNDVADAYLSVVNTANGTSSPYSGTDNLDVSGFGLYSDASCSTAIAGNKLAAMAAGGTQVVYVCSTIPGSAADGDISVVGLVAQVAPQGSSVPLASDDSGTDKNANLNTVYNIFADTSDGSGVSGGVGADTAKFDGAASALGAYDIKGASLSLTKTVKVIEDAICYDSTVLVSPIVAGTPACAGGATPHAIPGAYMEYTVTVSNASGAQSATSVNIQDTLPSTTTYVASSMTISDNGGAATACGDAGSPTVTIGSSPSSTATCTNNAGTGALKAAGFTVDAGRNVAITYQATVN
jgi:uncharacterized repeat protein (TIGR01451 family)